jgi:hypothetical protein
MGDLCRRIVAGGPMTIHYSTKAPKHNVASDPLTKLWNDAIAFCWPACCFLQLRFCSFADGGGENLTTSDAHNHRAVGKARSLVGAPLRHADRLRACPLIGVERKGPAHGQSDAIDPMRTLIKVLIGTAVIRLLDKRPCCARHPRHLL